MRLGLRMSGKSNNALRAPLRIAAELGTPVGAATSDSRRYDCFKHLRHSAPVGVCNSGSDLPEERLRPCRRPGTLTWQIDCPNFISAILLAHTVKRTQTFDSLTRAAQTSHANN
jgi:hypothetical protein